MGQPRKAILSRYARTDDGKVIVDIATSRIEDLYNRLDRAAPYSQKDLDGNIASYLLECAREVGPSPFVIRLSLFQEPTPQLINWIRNSICSYFLYWKDAELRRMGRMLRSSFLLLMLGGSIMLSVIWINRTFPVHQGVLTVALMEGLTVAAWVALWESLATFLVVWLPKRNEIKLLDRIAHAPVLLATMEQTDPKRTADVA